MKLKINAISDRGCVRAHNEDMVLIGSDLLRDATKDLEIDISAEATYFLAVADGLGGHKAGEVASELALASLREKLGILEPSLDEEALKGRLTVWLEEIHTLLLEEGVKDPQKKGMGATLCGLLIYGGRFFYLNAGDSRLYRYRNGNLLQISHDHTIRAQTGNMRISRSVLSNSVGAGEKIFVEFGPAGGKLLDGDVFLLCSDGLTDMLADDRIEEILSGDAPAERLLEAAKDSGGKDNISIILIDVAL